MQGRSGVGYKSRVFEDSQNETIYSFARRSHADEPSSLGAPEHSSHFAAGGATPGEAEHTRGETNEYYPSPSQQMYFDDPRRKSSHFMALFARSKMLSSVKQREILIDSRRVLSWALFLLFVEYVLYLTFQLISYFVIKAFWGSATYVLGTVFLVLYLPLACFLLMSVNNKELKLLLVLKAVEFTFYAVLLAWGVAYLDFSLLSLSYMPALNMAVIFALVRSQGPVV